MKVIPGKGILKKDKYSKLKISNDSVVYQLSKLDVSPYDCKAHFKVTLLPKSLHPDDQITFHIVPDVKTIVEDFFNPEISVDKLGSRNFLIIFMLVNARVMNIETGLETFFSSLKSQNFSGGSHGKLLNIVEP